MTGVETTALKESAPLMVPELSGWDHSPGEIIKPPGMESLGGILSREDYEPLNFPPPGLH